MRETADLQRSAVKTRDFFVGAKVDSLRLVSPVLSQSMENQFPSLDLLTANNVAQCDHYLTFTYVWIARVCNQHIVEHDDVMLLPGKRDSELTINVQQFINHVVFNLAAVTIINIPRKILLRHHRRQ